MPSFQYDLRYIREASTTIDRFLLSKDIYWPLGVAAPAGEPAYPMLSLGGLMLAERRARAQANSAADQSSLDKVYDPIQRAFSQWQTTMQNKAAVEARARCNQWGEYLSEYRHRPSEHADRYSYEVFRRVIVELLLSHLVPGAFLQADNLKHLDQLLKKFLEMGGFVWEVNLMKAFPDDSYWFLYGRLPKHLRSIPE